MEYGISLIIINQGFATIFSFGIFCLVSCWFWDRVIRSSRCIEGFRGGVLSPRGCEAAGLLGLHGIVFSSTSHVVVLASIKHCTWIWILIGFVYDTTHDPESHSHQHCFDGGADDGCFSLSTAGVESMLGSSRYGISRLESEL